MEYLENKLTYDQYRDLRASVGWKNFSEEQARTALKNSSYIISVFEHDTIIAMARLIGDGMYYIIVDVIVRPDEQKRGIGTALINRCLEYVEHYLPEGGRASVQLIAEKGKEEFYERLGFRLLPHEYCGSGMRKVFWRR